MVYCDRPACHLGAHPDALIASGPSTGSKEFINSPLSAWPPASPGWARLGAHHAHRAGVWVDGDDPEHGGRAGDSGYVGRREVRRIVARPGLRDGAAVSISAHHLGHQDRNWFGVLRPSLANRDVESVAILSPVRAHPVIVSSTSSQGPKALLSCFSDVYRASVEPLPDARINRLLDQARFAHVAVISDGDPYVGTLSFVRHGDALQFHPRAAVSIVEFNVETGSWESVLVRGDVSFLGSE